MNHLQAVEDRHAAQKEDSESRADSRDALFRKEFRYPDYSESTSMATYLHDKNETPITMHTLNPKSVAEAPVIVVTNERNQSKEVMNV